MPMPYYPNKNYSLITMWIAIGLICCLLVAGERFIQPAFNDIIGDINLASFEKGFQELQHLPESESLASRVELGDFDRYQQGCDLFLGEIRRYQGSPDAVLAAYQGKEVKGYALQVVFLAGDQIPAANLDPLPEPLDNPAGWGLPSTGDQDALYLVYLLVLDEENDLKFDCP